MYLNWLDFRKSFLYYRDFPSCFGLGVMWNLGFIIFSFYFFQIITGVIMVFFFKIGFEDCLKSKLFLIKEVELGWFINYLHIEFSNFLFFFLFFHILKSFYNSVSIYFMVWNTGYFILILFIFISFTGYSLAGGSLGFWAIVVFFGILEFLFGEMFSFFFLSDFGSLSDLILYKVFCYHFLISLIVMVFIFLHFYFVHFLGSSIGISINYIDFFSFFVSSLFKDFILDFLFFYLFFYILGFNIEYFFSLENFLELDFFKVPEEINSEWYLRLVFILLRSVNSKELGIFFIFLSFFIMEVKVYCRGIFGEKFFSRYFFFLNISFIILLTIFTLSKYGGSFYFTSFLLLFLFIVLDYIFLYLDRSIFFFDFY